MRLVVTGRPVKTIIFENVRLAVNGSFPALKRCGCGYEDPEVLQHVKLRAV